MRKLTLMALTLLVAVMSFAATIRGKVIKVADGDTITIQKANKERERIRFFGIDAPESTQDYGIKSLDVLKKLIYNKEVEVEIVEKDTYGRIVGIVRYEGKNLNVHMLETGSAWLYSYYAKDKEEFVNAEKKAKAEKLGLWGTKNPIAPWEYRKKNKK